MTHDNDNEELLEQNNKAAKAVIDTPPTFIDEHSLAIPEVLLPGGMGRVITINNDA